jgi:glycogen debranching enzyme
MLPNRFPDHGETPEFNSVDASLWYIVAVHDYLCARKNQTSGTPIADSDTQTLHAAIDAILTGYAEGTRFSIHADEDGLLACGPARRSTHMDGRQGG